MPVPTPDQIKHAEVAAKRAFATTYELTHSTAQAQAAYDKALRAALHEYIPDPDPILYVGQRTVSAEMDA